jgi:NADPH:quinone reductase-like Zn-dependent oxidoreductase
MKAAVYRRYGSPGVVSVDEVPRPVPRYDEVLVRIHAATLGVVDSLARRGAPFYARSHFGLRRPRFPVLGSDFAGQIEAIGPAVTRFAAGDQVFGAWLPGSAPTRSTSSTRATRCRGSRTRTAASTPGTRRATSSSR